MLRLYQEALIHTIDRLNEDVQVYFFSDCAYIRTKNFDVLRRFLELLRFRLFEDQVFFRAAIGAGDFEVFDVSDHPALKQGRRRVVDKLKGHFFGELAAELYSRHERLKGIGIDVPAAEAVSNASRIVASCFLEDSAKHRATVYYDFRIALEHQTPEVLRGILKQFLDSKTRSKKYGRYYVSLLVLWMQSMEIEGIRYDPQSSDDLINIVLSGKFEKYFGDVVGVENVVFCMLGRLRQPDIDSSIVDRARRYALGSRKWRDLMSAVPPQLFSSEAQRQYLDELGDNVLANPLAARVKILRSQGISSSEIAKMLNDEGHSSKSGASWTAKEVDKLFPTPRLDSRRSSG